MADIHARAMVVPRPWDAAAMRGLIDARGAVLVSEGMGFALGRIVADEAELLTIAVDPRVQGQGLGRTCLRRFEQAVQRRNADRILLEVAATNEIARKFYRSEGFSEDGVRAGYYRVDGAHSIDAILMSKALARA